MDGDQPTPPLGPAPATGPSSPPKTVVGTAQAIAQNHPTTASAGLGTSLSVAIMSLLLHFNVHLTEEEAIAWTGLITAFLGWFLRYLGHRYPVLDIPTQPNG